MHNRASLDEIDEGMDMRAQEGVEKESRLATSIRINWVAED